MLDKLRRQFILIIMALVTAALAIMAGVIIYINYQQLSNDVISAVEYATTVMAFEDHGTKARLDGPQGNGGPNSQRDANGNAASPDAASPDDANPDAASPDDAGVGDVYGVDGGQPRGKGYNRIERTASSDMVATSVYFVQEDGTVLRTLVDALELEDDELKSALEGALAARGTTAQANQCVTGHLSQGDLYFGVRETTIGTKVAFASGTYVTNSITNLALVLAGVSACVWVAFLLISMMLARWVVRPTERAWNQQQQFVADASHELKRG